MFIVYCITAISFYLVVTLPVLRSVSLRIRKAWRVVSLVPNEVMKSVLKENY